MGLTVAVLGAGRMGAFVGEQLPKAVKKIVVDSDEAKAKALAEKIGARWFLSAAGAADADVIVIVLPAPAVDGVARALTGIAREGAIIVNMATSVQVAAEIKAADPKLCFVEAKIIGNAKAMAWGAPSYVVVDTADREIYRKISDCLPGYTKVVTGDASLVAALNTIGSAEGIRAAVSVRKQLKKYQVPKDWEDVVIATVCAGTMLAYVDGDLGEFGRKLADKLEAEA